MFHPAAACELIHKRRQACFHLVCEVFVNFYLSKYLAMWI